MAYKKVSWISVPDPSNPPGEAKALSAENLDHMDEGIKGAHDEIATIKETFEKTRPGIYGGSGYFTHHFPFQESETKLEISLGENKDYIDRVTVYLSFDEIGDSMMPPIILYLNKNGNMPQKGVRTATNAWNYAIAWTDVNGNFSLRLLYDRHHNDLDDSWGATWIKNPKIEDGKIIIPLFYCPDPKDGRAWDMEVTYFWENS